MPDAFIVVNPMIAANKSTEVTLSKFLRIISPCFSRLIVIGGNLSVEPDLKDTELVSFEITRAGSKVRRAFDIIGVQVKMFTAIRHRLHQDDKVFFWIADKMILPFWAAKSCKAEINYFIMGNVAKEGSANLFTRISAKLIRYMAEHADYTCMESKSVIDEWPGLKTNKIRVIHLYTDKIGMNPIEDREKIIGMVCRLAEGKHVLECIEAMVDVHVVHPEWKLEIIGSGRQQAECEQMIKELHAEDYIYLLGWIEHDRIIDYTERWKFFLFPTDTEGMPNGLIEMMGRGIPPLASPVGGIKDIVENNVNGILLENNTRNSIKEGILQFICFNNKIYSNYAIAALNTVACEYSIDGAISNAKTVFEMDKKENAKI